MIEELRRFVLAAEEGSITKAAEKIFITQSALTQSIQRLEKEIGAKLFRQSGRYLELTADGTALKVIGERILDLWKRAKDREVREAMKPALTVGMFDNAAYRLADFVRRSMMPGKLKLELLIDNSGRLLNFLQLGVIDMAILVKGKQFYPKDIVCLQVFEEELVPVSKSKFSGSIKDIPFILFNKGSNTREQIDDAFFQAGIKPKVFAESTSPDFMKELAILNCGVALLPENLVRQELKQKVLRKQELPLKWKREYGIFVQRNSDLEYMKTTIEEMTRILRGE